MVLFEVNSRARMGSAPGRVARGEHPGLGWVRERLCMLVRWRLVGMSACMEGCEVKLTNKDATNQAKWKGDQRNGISDATQVGLD